MKIDPELRRIYRANALHCVRTVRRHLGDPYRVRVALEDAIYWRQKAQGVSRFGDPGPRFSSLAF